MAFSTLVGLARKAEIKHSVLRAILAKVDANYRLVRIPKSTPGEFRTLSVPTSALKAIQRAICAEALERLAPSPHAHAYTSHKSIISHATLHKDSRRFIQIDLKNFFPSVGPERVRKVFLDLGYGTDVAEALTKLCTFEGGLPQGAPTSPSLSNAVLWELDVALNGLATTYQITYSRYADDLVLSGRNVTAEVFQQAIELVEAAGFQVNLKKSRMMLKPKKVVLTGISISTGTTKVPRRFKRAVRSSSYKLLATGIAAFSVNDKFDPFAADRVIGRLLFWSRVEPEAEFPRRYLALIRARFFGRPSAATS